MRPISLIHQLLTSLQHRSLNPTRGTFCPLTDFADGTPVVHITIPAARDRCSLHNPPPLQLDVFHSKLVANIFNTNHLHIRFSIRNVVGRAQPCSTFSRLRTRVRFGPNEICASTIFHERWHGVDSTSTDRQACYCQHTMRSIFVESHGVPRGDSYSADVWGRSVRICPTPILVSAHQRKKADAVGAGRRKKAVSLVQYSSGKRIVVAERSASVMTQILVPSASRYAERMRSPSLIANSFSALSSSSSSPQSPAACRTRKGRGVSWAPARASSAPGVATVWPRGNREVEIKISPDQQPVFEKRRELRRRPVLRDRIESL